MVPRVLDGALHARRAHALRTPVARAVRTRALGWHRNGDGLARSDRRRGSVRRARRRRDSPAGPSWTWYPGAPASLADRCRDNRRLSQAWRTAIDTSRRAVVFGVAFLLVYPLMVIWPSGWAWQPGQHEYEQMIVGIYATLGVFLLRASREPERPPQPDLVHGLVERGARRDHGRAGDRRSPRTWSPAGRRRRAVSRRWRARLSHPAGSRVRAIGPSR